MRKSRFIETQIIGMIKEQEAGMPPLKYAVSSACHMKAFIQDWPSVSAALSQANTSVSTRTLIFF